MAFNENHATRVYDGQTLKERHPDLSAPFPKVRYYTSQRAHNDRVGSNPAPAKCFVVSSP
jgi:hypothetical protein